MNPLEIAQIIHFHRNRLHLNPKQSLGWRTAESQICRFKMLCQWGDLSHCKILDIGCGLGDLKLYLDKHFNDITYFGVDLMEEFISQALKRFHQDPNSYFLCADFQNTLFPPVDVIMACGSLNYRTENHLHPYSIIRKMWDHAQRGIAFNLIRKDTLHGEGLLQGYDPQEILEFCRQLDSQALLIENYHPEDFTILMHR